MSESHWLPETLKTKMGKFIVFVLLIIIGVIVWAVVVQNRPIKAGPIEVGSQETNKSVPQTKHDTIYVTKNEPTPTRLIKPIYVKQPVNSKQKKPKEKVAADTVVNNKVDFTGNNNHVVNGNGNNVGVNGDLNISNEKRLTDYDKVKIIELIESVRIKEKIQSKCIFMKMMNTSNGALFVQEMGAFLKESGYNIEMNAITIGEAFKGIGAGKLTNADCVEITVGTL